MEIITHRQLLKILKQLEETSFKALRGTKHLNQGRKGRKRQAVMKMGLTPPITFSPRACPEIIKAPLQHQISVLHFKKTTPKRKKRKKIANQKLFLLEQLLEGRFCLGLILVTRFQMEP